MVVASRSSGSFSVGTHVDSTRVRVAVYRGVVMSPPSMELRDSHRSSRARVFIVFEGFSSILGDIFFSFTSLTALDLCAGSIFESPAERLACSLETVHEGLVYWAFVDGVKAQ